MGDKDHCQDPKQNRAQGQELRSQLHLVSQEKLKKHLEKSRAALIGFVNKNYFGTAAAAAWEMGLRAGWALNTSARGVRRGTAGTARRVGLDKAGQGGDKGGGPESLSSLREPRAPGARNILGPKRTGPLPLPKTAGRKGRVKSQANRVFQQGTGWFLLRSKPPSRKTAIQSQQHKTSILRLIFTS